MATKHCMVMPLDFCNGLLIANVITNICDLWKTDIAAIETEDGELIPIGSERTWERWLYGENGNPPITPDKRNQILLGIKYRELME